MTSYLAPAAIDAVLILVASDMASAPNTTVAGVLLVARQLPIATVLAEHVSLALETDMGSR